MQSSPQHIARSLQNYALSRRALDLDRIGMMVQSYFPPLPLGKEGVKSIADSKLLYIRCMREADIPLLIEYRADVERWMKTPM